MKIWDSPRPQRFGRSCRCCLLAVNFDFVYFSLAGMETAFLAVILLLMAWLALRRPASLALPVLGRLAFLVHPEAVAVYPVYVLLGTGPFFGRWTFFVSKPLAENMHLSPSTQGGQSQTNLRSVPRRTKIGTVPARRFVMGLSMLVLLVGAITAVRYGYFHDVVPNTFHSKPSASVAGGRKRLPFLVGPEHEYSLLVAGLAALAGSVAWRAERWSCDARGGANACGHCRNGHCYSPFIANPIGPLPHATSRRICRPRCCCFGRAWWRWSVVCRGSRCGKRCVEPCWSACRDAAGHGRFR